ncbi:O-antigen ligase family protein [Tannockella kyphosi]|uniref:O-antigen ligase family protein n=1 Tax=Tannockella kyphosi TaxID=2899121 RepID=UPI002012D936|nr:O-antigen ligase family protein [Tannockella kyphosi]
MLKEIHFYNLIKIGFFLSLVLIGGYFEFASGLLTIYFTGCLLFASKDKFTFNKDKTIYSVIIIVMMYLLVIPFSTDISMGIIGFVKYLPLIPIVLLVAKLEKEEKENILKTIPICGVLMTMFSFFVSFFEGLDSFFNVSGRYAGLFQYPNTFALFLLIGLIVLVHQKEDKNKLYYIYCVVLMGGLFMSGSRTGMILMVLSLLMSCFLKETRRNGIVLGVILAIGWMFSLAWVVFNGEIGTIGRYLTASLSSSTFVGRILYVIDALPVIFSNPLGLGYMGYQFLQGSFQTGVYNVAYVHNDFLQLFLDVGWVAGVLFILLAYRAITSKENCSMFRMIALFISLHTLLDFHLQYISIFLIFILVLDYQPISKVINKKKKSKIKQITVKNKVVYGFAVVSILFSGYMGSALFLEYMNQDDLSLTLFSMNSRIYMDKIYNTVDVDEANEYANKILDNGDDNMLSYRAKADWYFKSGMVEDTVENKLKQIELSKYDLDAYKELIEMLVIFKDLYNDSGDMEGVMYCTGILQSIPTMLEEVENNTSSLAYKITDQPDLELPSEYIYYCYTN